MCTTDASTRAALALAILLSACGIAQGGVDAVGAPPAVRLGLIETETAAALAGGAEAAVAELNARGGIDGHRVELIRLAPPRPWRNGAALMARLVADEGLLAVVGPGGDTDAHVAAQIATRRRLPVLVLSPEDSLTRAMVPWIFRGVPGDGDQARALLGHVLTGRADRRVAIVVPDGREGRERLAAVTEACRDLEATVVAVQVAGDPSARPAIDRSAVLMVWLDAEAAVALLRGLGPDGAPPVILGSSRLDDRRFLTRAPRWADGLLLPLLRDAGRSGDLGAALGYEMVHAVATAARRTAARPGNVRDWLASGAELVGSAGTYHFDERGNRRGRIPVAALRSGRLFPVAE